MAMGAGSRPMEAQMFTVAKRLVLNSILPAALFAPAGLLAVAGFSPAPRPIGIELAQPAPITVKSRKPIDKSCLMMCDRWTDDGCAKWVMRCKGDPGYPKGMTLSQ